MRRVSGAAIIAAAWFAPLDLLASPEDADAAVVAAISLDFQDVEIRTALQLIADFAGFNLVAGDEVAGRITMRLVDVPWDEALDLILATEGLSKLHTGNVVYVAPVADIATVEKAGIERRRELNELAPLQTAFIPVRYADASALAAFGRDDGAPAALSASGSVRVDARTNSLIVHDTAENLAAFRRVIERLDVPVRQVWIEARIVTANSNASEELGIRWRARVDSADRTDVPNSALRLSDDADGANVSYGILGADYLLDVELSALAAAGHAEIVARPKVVTGDQHTALIESGVEIPYQQATRSGATSIAFKDAVLQLAVTPRITPEDDIVMELDIKQDTVGRIYHGVPSINTTRIETRVRVADGETVVLGGIFQTDRYRTATQTPLLGDLPLIGRVFRRTLERDDKQELFIFITPRSADDTSVPDLRGERVLATAEPPVDRVADGLPGEVPDAAVDDDGDTATTGTPEPTAEVAVVDEGDPGGAEVAAARDVVDAGDGEAVGRTADSGAAADGDDVPREAVVVDRGARGVRPSHVDRGARGVRPSHVDRGARGVRPSHVDTVPEPAAEAGNREAAGDAYEALFALAAAEPAEELAEETEAAGGPDGPAEAKERVLYKVVRQAAGCAVVSVRPGSLRGNAARMLRACGYALGRWPLKDEEYFRDWVVSEGFGADVEGVAGVVELVTGLTGYEIRASVVEKNRVVDFAEVAR